MTQEPSGHRPSASEAPLIKAWTSSYPLVRCPQCSNAFRDEVKNSAGSQTELVIVTCPRCHAQFHRFSLSIV